MPRKKKTKDIEDVNEPIDVSTDQSQTSFKFLWGDALGSGVDKPALKTYAKNPKSLVQQHILEPRLLLQNRNLSSDEKEFEKSLDEVKHEAVKKPAKQRNTKRPDVTKNVSEAKKPIEVLRNHFQGLENSPIASKTRSKVAAKNHNLIRTEPKVKVANLKQKNAIVEEPILEKKKDKPIKSKTSAKENIETKETDETVKKQTQTSIKAIKKVKVVCSSQKVIDKSHDKTQKSAEFRSDTTDSDEPLEIVRKKNGEKNISQSKNKTRAKELSVKLLEDEHLNIPDESNCSNEEKTSSENFHSAKNEGEPPVELLDDQPENSTTISNSPDLSNFPNQPEIASHFEQKKCETPHIEAKRNKTVFFDLVTPERANNQSIGRQSIIAATPFLNWKLGKLHQSTPMTKQNSTIIILDSTNETTKGSVGVNKMNLTSKCREIDESQMDIFEDCSVSVVEKSINPTCSKLKETEKSKIVECDKSNIEIIVSNNPFDRDLTSQSSVQTFAQITKNFADVSESESEFSKNPDISTADVIAKHIYNSRSIRADDSNLTNSFHGLDTLKINQTSIKNGESLPNTNIMTVSSFQLSETSESNSGSQASQINVQTSQRSCSDNDILKNTHITLNSTKNESHDVKLKSEESLSGESVINQTDNELDHQTNRQELTDHIKVPEIEELPQIDPVFKKPQLPRFSIRPERLKLLSGKKWRKSLLALRQSLGALNEEADARIVADAKTEVDAGRNWRRFSVKVVENNFGTQSRYSTPNQTTERARPENDQDLEDSKVLQENSTDLTTASKEDNRLDDESIRSASEVNQPYESNSYASNDVTADVLDEYNVVRLSACELVLKICKQKDFLAFERLYSDNCLESCRKIGEGVYGEVFQFQDKCGKVVIKIVPVAGDVIVNGEKQKSFKDVLSEIVITQQLSNLRTNGYNCTDAFVQVRDIKCVRGAYPKRLIALWEMYDEANRSENDHPRIFPEDQTYIVYELAHGGQDLESYVFRSAAQAYAIFMQTVHALAVAEEELEFEHRDLHWGNLLISPTHQTEVEMKLCDKTLTIPTCGLRVTIIDYTLSRCTYNGLPVFEDLAQDPDLFEGDSKDEFQFEVYRMMRDCLDNDWSQYNPTTNIIWLLYVAKKMLEPNGLRYSVDEDDECEHYEGIRKLRKIMPVLKANAFDENFKTTMSFLTLVL